MFENQFIDQAPVIKQRKQRNRNNSTKQETKNKGGPCPKTKATSHTPHWEQALLIAIKNAELTAATKVALLLKSLWKEIKVSRPSQPKM